jgi:RimJ/RimL family protein N-acetyltransferase
LIVTGEPVALRPLREDLVPVYARWLTTLEVARGLGNTIIYTVEAEKGWYEQAAKPDPGQAHFTVYDRFDLEPIGTTGLINIDHRHGTATFGIMLGERRGQGLGLRPLGWCSTGPSPCSGCTTWIWWCLPGTTPLSAAMRRPASDK